MNITIISGSRNKEGQTAKAINAIAQGAAEGGSQIKQYFLPTMHVERCRQCDPNGWGTCRTKGKCVITDDDFALLFEDVRAADMVVFATPVYFSDLSESLRAFLDRFRRVCRSVEGKKGITAKKAIGICVAGGGGGGAYACSTSLEKILQNCEFNILDIIPVRRQNLEMKVEILRLTGKWLTTAK